MLKFNAIVSAFMLFASGFAAAKGDGWDALASLLGAAALAIWAFKC